MIAAVVRPATAEDAYMLGIIAPAAYAEAYAYLWDDPGAYSEQLQSFGQRAFEALLTQSDARVWVGEVAGTTVGFLSMIVGSLDPVEHRPRGAELLRIYILGSAQRMGLGRLLVDAAVKRAAAEGYPMSGLTSWPRLIERGAPMPSGGFTSLVANDSKRS